MSNPRFPVYVISKGRWEARLTSRALEKISVPYRIVIEPQEFDSYAAVIDPKRILLLPFSNLGLGGIPARNWVWEHSKKEGHARHWILDDNIRYFYRLHLNHRTHVADGTIFRAAEDFVERYENVALAGFQYSTFAPTTKPHRVPYILNNRIYSCLLIQNDIPFRWRGRYNEDTDLSLRILKAGLCTVLFKAFLCAKQATMVSKGGNTDELYKQDEKFDGRLEMARSLWKQHPDCVRIARRWGRWQHVVDYRRWRGNKLKLRPGIQIAAGKNEYGMKLIKLRTQEAR